MVILHSYVNVYQRVMGMYIPIDGLMIDDHPPT